MSTHGSREQTWSKLESHGPWDLVIVGGGITGALSRSHRSSVSSGVLARRKR